MITLPLILGMEINLVEIIIFQLGAILLGFAIHFFIFSKRSFRITSGSASDMINEQEHSRLRMYEDMDQLESENDRLSNQLKEAEKVEQELQDEIRSLREEKLQLLEEQEGVQSKAFDSTDKGYLALLQATQQRMLEHNQQAGTLLEQISRLKEAEQHHVDVLKQNEELQDQVRDLQRALSDKDADINQMRQQYSLNKELQDRLEKAHGEFNLLQDKIQKMEMHIARPQNRSFEFDEMQQAFLKLSREFDEMKLKLLQVTDENQKLSRQLSDAQDKLQESNFHRQQLMKKVTYLEELNRDVQQVSEQNKNLESQLRRISEIEALLAKLAGKPTDPSDVPPSF